MSVRCGNHPRGSKVNHETAEDVRDCYAGRYHDEAEAKAEQEMEKRQERWYEERGGAEDDPRERALWAEEDMRREANRPTDLIEALEASVREKRFIDEQEAEHAAAVLDGMTGSHGRDMASRPQVDYAMDLLKQRVWPDDLTRSDLENMERGQVTKLINGLKIAPKRPGVKTTVLQASDWEHIPAGRYAFVDPGDDGVSYSYVDRQDLVPPRKRTVRFYQVDLPTKPMWKGRVFVSQLFGSPGDYRKEPRRGDAAVAIMEAIGKDPREAAATFGKETQHCGRCMSPLTHERSRAAGYGQKCASKMGWIW